MMSPENRQEQFPQPEEQTQVFENVAVLPPEQSILDMVRESRLGVAVATVATVGAMGLALARDEASAARTYVSIASAPYAKKNTMGGVMSKKPIRAYQLASVGDRRDYNRGPRTKGPLIQELNDLSIWIPPKEANLPQDVIDQSIATGVEANKKTLNNATRSCQTDTLKSSVGKQKVILKAGTKKMKIVSQLYDTESFFLDTPNPKGPAQWQYDCDDVISTTYTFQALRRKGKKVTKLGEPVSITNNDGSWFDTRVRESKRKSANIALPSKVGKVRSKTYGYKTTVRSTPVATYPGQVVTTSVPPKSRSWTRWVK